MEHQRNNPFLRMAAHLNPRVLFSVPTPSRRIALTIDDGPHEQVTPRILDVLAEHGAHCTFFITGGRVPGNEGPLTRMVEEGHEVANHMMSTLPSILLGTRRFHQELVRAHGTLEPYNVAPWFRPAFGYFSNGMLDQAERAGYRCVLGNIYPHDTKLRSVPLISRFVVSRAAPGGIIILHDGKADRMRTPEVLATALPQLKRDGHEIVTVSELVQSAVA